MNSRLRQIILSLLLIIATIIGSFASSTAKADGGLESLALANRDYYPGDLYASIIFSESAGSETADSVDLSFNKIESYPSLYDHTITYGRLLKPEEGGTAKGTAGKQLSSMLKTLYGYGWFEPSPVNESGVIGWISQTLGWAKDTVSWYSFTGFTLWFSAIAQGMFWIIAGSIMIVNSALTHVNIPALFGFGKDDLDGWIESTISAAFNLVGLDVHSVGTIRAFVYALIVFAFIITIIKTLSKSNGLSKDNIAKPFKNYGSRALVIMIVIPLSIMMTFIIDSISVKASTLSKTPNLLNSAYVVDTVDWAVYGNFDLSMINPHGSLNKDGSIAKDFAPTPANVSRLNAAIQAKKALIGPTPEDADKIGEHLSEDEKERRSQLKSSDLLMRFASRTESNVTAYFDGLAVLRDNAFSSCGLYDPSLAADASEARRREQYDFADITVGYINKTTPGTQDKNYIYDACGSVYFLTPKGSNSASDTTTGGATGSTSQPAKITMAGQTFKIGDSSPVSVKPFSPNDPQSYIYGAVPNVSKSTKEFSNYIHDPEHTSQLINPETGENVSAAEGSSAEDLKAKAIWTNSLRIALANRYRGLKPLSFSDQSTAFFLQTQRSGESSVAYKGYYTVASKAGESKNTGSYGTTFVRYVVPSSSMAEMSVKLNSLAAIWQTSVIVAVGALFIMLRSPLLGAMTKAIKGFASALFTGNVVGLIDFALYYTAMRMSVMFVGVAVFLGTTIASWISVDTNLLSIASVVDSAKAATIVGNLAPSLSTVVVLLSSAVVLWPSIRMMNSKGVMEKKSIVGVIINLPMLIADMLSEKADTVHQKAYGHSRGQGFMGLSQKINRGSKSERREDKKQRKSYRRANQSTLKKAGKAGLEVGAHAAAAVATGGASVGASKAVMLAKARKGLGGFAGAIAKSHAATTLSKNDQFQRLIGSDDVMKKIMSIDGLAERLVGQGLLPKTEEVKKKSEAHQKEIEAKKSREDKRKGKINPDKEQDSSRGNKSKDGPRVDEHGHPALKVFEGGKSDPEPESRNDSRVSVPSTVEKNTPVTRENTDTQKVNKTETETVRHLATEEITNKRVSRDDQIIPRVDQPIETTVRRSSDRIDIAEIVDSLSSSISEMSNDLSSSVTESMGVGASIMSNAIDSTLKEGIESIGDQLHSQDSQRSLRNKTGESIRTERIREVTQNVTIQPSGDSQSTEKELKRLSSDAIKRLNELKKDGEQ